MKILKIDPVQPEASLIEEAAAILREGGIVAYPTETFYALGVDGENEQAVEKIFHVKGRAFRNPIALIIGSEAPLEGLIAEMPAAGRTLAGRAWPGPLTLVMKASAKVSPRLTAQSGKIGIRISSHPIAAALAAALGRAITATSANLSGAPECNGAQQVWEQLGGLIDAVVDGGATSGGKGSTFLDITVEPPLMLREGAVSGSLIRSWLEK